MQKYISVDSNTSATNTQVKMTNENNEFNGTVQGTLKTTDSQDNKVKDVNDIFANKKELETLIKKENVKDMKTIDNEDYDLETVVTKLNDLIKNLQK